MFSQSLFNSVHNSATAAFIDIYGNTYCNGILIANNALTLNSTFTQMILNLLYDSATAAYIYMYGNTCCNLVFNSATASYIYVYGNSSCNGTLTANNAPPPNNTFTQSILKIRYMTVLVQHICTLMEHLFQWNIDSQ